MEDDPLKRLVMAEKAEATDLAVLEALATDLLVDVPASTHYQTGILFAATGEEVLCSTIVYENDDVAGACYAEIRLADADDETVFYQRFNYDNELINGDTVPYMGPTELAQARSIVIQATDPELELNDNLTAVVRYLQVVLALESLATDDTRVSILPAADQPHIADIIREMVAAKATSGIIYKEFSHRISENEVITVIQHKVTGDTEPEELLSAPPELAVVYEDRATDQAYCYAQNRNNSSTLEKKSIQRELLEEAEAIGMGEYFSLPDIETDEEDPIESIVTKFRQAMGIDGMPDYDDIQLMIDKLLAIRIQTTDDKKQTR